MKYFSTYNVESYFFLRLIYLITNFSLSLSLSLSLGPSVRISDLVFSFYRTSKAIYLNQVRNAHSRSFSARFPDHDVISACMHRRRRATRRGDRAEAWREVVSHLLHTCSWKARASWHGVSAASHVPKNGVGWGGALVVHFIIEISAELIARHDYSIVINVHALFECICYIALHRI